MNGKLLNRAWMVAKHGSALTRVLASFGPAREAAKLGGWGAFEPEIATPRQPSPTKNRLSISAAPPPFPRVLGVTREDAARPSAATNARPIGDVLWVAGGQIHRDTLMGRIFAVGP